MGDDSLARENQFDDFFIFVTLLGNCYFLGFTFWQFICEECSTWNTLRINKEKYFCCELRYQ